MKRVFAMIEPQFSEYTALRYQDIAEMRIGTKVHRVGALVLEEALNRLLHPGHCVAGFLKRERSTPGLETDAQDAERRRNRIAIGEI